MMRRAVGARRAAGARAAAGRGAAAVARCGALASFSPPPPPHPPQPSSPFPPPSPSSRQGVLPSCQIGLSPAPRDRPASGAGEELRPPFPGPDGADRGPGAARRAGQGKRRVTSTRGSSSRRTIGLAWGTRRTTRLGSPTFLPRSPRSTRAKRSPTRGSRRSWEPLWRAAWSSSASRSCWPTPR